MRAMRKTRVLRIVVVILSFLAGCRSEDSVVDDGADVQTKPNSVAAARYFPTDDGKGDETYEVVLRNSGAAPIELPAQRDAAGNGIIRDVKKTTRTWQRNS